MLSEVLLILAGHPSSFVEAIASDGTPSMEGGDVAALMTDAELLAALGAKARVRGDVPLRAGERAQLESLVAMAYKFRVVRRFSQVQIDRARTQILRRTRSRSASGRSDERVTAHLAPLCGAILAALDDYLARVMALEQAVLSRDPGLVASHSFVSLLSLRADLADWQPRLDALIRLVSALLDGPRASQSLLGLPGMVDTATLPEGLGGWTGGLLIDLLAHAADTGIARVADLMTFLRDAVEHSWSVLLIDWVCHGIASGSPISLGSHLVSPGRDALVEQVDSSPNSAPGPSDGWALRPWALPHCIPAPLADTILYLGRAVHRVKFFASSDRVRSAAGPVPLTLVTVHAARLRQPDVRPCQPLVFAQVLLDLQQEVGEWLWRTVLTNEAVISALEDLGHFFLLRSGSFTYSLLLELERIRREKRLYARTASLAALHDADLETALHRASLGTELEDHPSLDRIHWRPMQTDSPDQSVLIRLGLDTTPGAESVVEKCTALAGLPGYQLSYTAEFPLDLFLSPIELTCYSNLFSYLLALCHTQRRVVACWTSLSNSQRVRRKFTGIGEGGVDHKEAHRRTHLLRLTWCLARDLIWFLDTLLGHFQTDVIEVQYGNLLGQLSQAHERHDRPKRGSNASSVGSPSRAPSSLPGLIRRPPRKHAVSSPSKQSGSPLKDRLLLEELEDHTKLPFPSASRRGGAPSVPRADSPDLDPPRIRAHSSPADRLRPGSAATGSPRKGRPSLGGRSGASPWESAPVGTAFTAAETGTGHSGPSRARLDFADLRTLHLTFLAYVQEGLLLTSPPLTQLIQAIVANCERFAGQIDRWGGDVLPDLLSEGSLEDPTESHVLDDRYRSMLQLVLEVREQLRDFFEFVAEGPQQAEPTLPSGPKSNPGGNTGGGAEQSGAAEQLRLAMGAANREHLTQLAARLDFNGFFTGTNLRHYEEAQRARVAQAAAKR